MADLLPTPGLRVIELKAENIKRLSAVDIKPGAAGVVTIAGRNAQGKSSVLDSIAMALGGVKLVPKQPIKAGQARGSVTVDLGDYVVTRTFDRDRLPCDCQPAIDNPGDAHPRHEAKCASLTKFGPTRSVLKVKSREGAMFPSPQALLDKLVGNLTFDPLAFLKLKPAEQDTTLRKLAGVDTKDLDDKWHVAFEARTVINRDVKALEARIAVMPKHDDAPAGEIPVSTIAAELEAAHALRRAFEAALRDVDAAKNNLAVTERDVQDIDAEILKLTKQLGFLQKTRTAHAERLEQARDRVYHANDAAAAADAAVPDTTAIQARLAEVDTLNLKARENLARERTAAELEKLKKQAQGCTDLLADAEDTKRKLLAGAKFPIAGLSIDPELGPVFGGQSLEQASTAERLRVSVAMGLALNPRLKVLLVHEGNDLDDDGLTLLGEIAAEHEAQVWLERIAGSDTGVAIVIEDGAVKA